MVIFYFFYIYETLHQSFLPDSSEPVVLGNNPKCMFHYKYGIELKTQLIPFFVKLLHAVQNYVSTIVAQKAFVQWSCIYADCVNFGCG